MIEVKTANKDFLKPLFRNQKDSLVLSCIQNYFGRAWIDTKEEPKSGLIIVGDFCYFAGIPKEELVINVLKAAGREEITAVPENEQWGSLIQQIHGKHCRKIQRYGIKKEGDIFDREKLEKYVESIKEPYRICLMGAREYKISFQEEWSKDWCRNFKDWEDFKNRGLGVVIYHGEKVVAGASSYTSYKEGIEVDISVHPDYRQRGLATAVGAKLVLESLKRGLYPNWDARNLMSVEVAKKLGYHYDGPYTAYEIFS